MWGTWGRYQCGKEKIKQWKPGDLRTRGDNITIALGPRQFGYLGADVLSLLKHIWWGPGSWS
jgi:hypothetical protein